METRAALTNVSRDYFSQKMTLTFLCESDVDISAIDGKVLRLTAKEWKNKRSLNANAYFFKLVSLIAEASKASITEIHNRLIADYGFPDELQFALPDDDRYIHLETVHLKPLPRTATKDTGETLRVFQLMRGSHTYNTKEMAHLIDMTVQEAKEMGIETLPPHELERMVKAWRSR